jgi:membrane associated rhomboid family serine protease
MIFWFISQIFIAVTTSNISWEAHIGGFITGYLLLKILNYKRYNV